MKIFLLGATGDTGYEVLKKLISENHKVKILVRIPSKLNTADIPNLQKDQIEVIQGSVMEAEKLIDLFKDCDAIVSALGTGKTILIRKSTLKVVEISLQQCGPIK